MLQSKCHSKIVKYGIFRDSRRSNVSSSQDPNYISLGTVLGSVVSIDAPINFPVEFGKWNVRYIYLPIGYYI